MTKKLSFEEALERLEELVGELEQGDIKLDEMVKKYEEGAQLINFCMLKLRDVEGKIKKLSGKDETDFKLDDIES